MPCVWWPTVANLRPKTMHITPTPQPHHTTFQRVVRCHHEKSSAVWLWCGVPGLWTKVGTRLKIRRFQLSANCRQLAVPQHRCKRSSSGISTASEDSCVCGAVGTRSALEALRLYLGCVRLCALQIDIDIYITLLVDRHTYL